jgi:hypothetical protein
MHQVTVLYLHTIWQKACSAQLHACTRVHTHARAYTHSCRMQLESVNKSLQTHTQTLLPHATTVLAPLHKRALQINQVLKITDVLVHLHSRHHTSNLVLAAQVCLPPNTPSVTRPSTRPVCQPHSLHITPKSTPPYPPLPHCQNTFVAATAAAAGHTAATAAAGTSAVAPVECTDQRNG